MSPIAEAGSVFVSVIPSMRGFATKVNSELKSIGDVRVNVTGNVDAKKLKADTEAAAKSAGATVKVDADIAGVKTAIKNTESALADLKKKVAADNPQLDLDIRAAEAKAAKLQADLDALRKLDASPQVDLKIAKAEADLGRVNTALDALRAKKVTPEVTAQITQAEADLTRFRADLDRLSAQRANVAVDADTGGALAKIAAFRVEANKLVGQVKTKVDLDTGGALAKLGFLKTAMTSLALPAGIIAATPYLLSLGSSAVQAAGGLALIPAAMTAGGLALGAFKIATAGVGKAIGDAFDPTKAKAFAKDLQGLTPPAREFVLAVAGIKPQFDALQSSVAGAFFKDMGRDVSALAGIYMPTLSATLGGIAVGFNQAEGEAAGWLRTSYGSQVVRAMMSQVGAAVQNVTAAIGPLIIAFLQIGAIGAPILVQLTSGAGTAAARFSEWVTSAQGINIIRGWILGAIAVIHQLVSIALNVGLILRAMFTAGAQSGESFLGILVRVTGAVAAALQTPAGAAMLGQVMAGIRDVVAMLWDKLVILWPAIAAAGQAFFSLMVAAAPVTNLFYSLLVPALTAVFNVINFLAPVLGPLLGLFIAWRVTMIGVAVAMDAYKIAMIGVNVVQALFSVELWATAAAVLAATWPILAIIAAVALLAVGIYFLVANWSTVWGFITSIASAAWTGFLQPVFSAIGTAITAVGTFFVWLWQSVIVPAWNGIMTVISAVWTGFLQPVFTAIGTALMYLGVIVATIFLAPFVIAWNIISAVAMLVWTSVLQPIFAAIQVGLSVLGLAFSYFWQAVIVPVWNGIVLAVTFAWGIIQAIWYGAVIPAINFLGSIFMWLWTAVVMPAWNGIVLAITFAWGIIQAIWYGAIVPALNFLGSVFTWLWQNIVVPVWNGIQLQIQVASNVIMAIWNGAVVPALQFLGSIFMWLWHNVVEPVWNGISAAISGAWAFIQGVFDVGKAAVNAVGQAFQFVADWIGRAWATIKEACRAPVQFVVDVVYNNGIAAVWNKIAGIFGLGQLPLVHMATGGVIPGYAPGRDTVPAVLSRGEGVLVPEAVRGLGPSFVGWANRFFSSGRSNGGPGTGGGGRGYSKGGVAHFAGGGIVDALLSGGAEITDFLTTAFTDPIGAVKKLFAAVLGDGARVPGGPTFGPGSGVGSWTEALKQVAPKTIEAIIGKVKDWIASIGSMGGAGGWAPVALMALAMAGQSPSNLGRVLAQIQIESSGNPNAINLTDVNARAGHPSMGLLQTIITTFNSYAGPLRGLGPFNPLANIYAAIRYTVATYGSLAKWPTRGGYDNGGLASGTGLMMKQTIAPERVLSPRQTAAFESLVPMLQRVSSGQSVGDFTPGRYGSDPIVINVYPSERMDETQLAEAVQHRLDWRMGLINS